MVKSIEDRAQRIYNDVDFIVKNREELVEALNKWKKAENGFHAYEFVSGMVLGLVITLYIAFILTHGFK